MADEDEVTEEIEALRAIYPDLDITDLSENGGQGTSRGHRIFASIGWGSWVWPHQPRLLRITFLGLPG